MIERDLPKVEKGLNKLDINDSKEAQRAKKQRDKENYERGRIVKTTNIDFFLNCENMAAEEVIEEKKSAADEEEEDPLWNDVDVEQLKTENPQLTADLS